MENMKKLIYLLIILFFSTLLKAEVITNFSEIIENAKKYDKKIIELQGEILNESMERTYGSWINISDGSMAIGLWIKKEDVKKLMVFGNYKHIGDIIKGKGIFNRACKEHTGELDIHVINMEIIKRGYTRELIPDLQKIIITITFFVILLIVTFIYFKHFYTSNK